MKRIFTLLVICTLLIAVPVVAIQNYQVPSHGGIDIVLQDLPLNTTVYMNFNVINTEPIYLNIYTNIAQTMTANIFTNNNLLGNYSIGIDVPRSQLLSLHFYNPGPSSCLMYFSYTLLNASITSTTTMTTNNTITTNDTTSNTVVNTVYVVIPDEMGTVIVGGILGVVIVISVLIFKKQRDYIIDLEEIVGAGYDE